MAHEFDGRRRFLFGVLESGLAALLASCASAYSEREVSPQPEEPRPTTHRLQASRVVPHRKKLPVEPTAPKPLDDIPATTVGGGGGGGNGGGGSGPSGGWSDRRLKHHIQLIGQSASGIPIYQFCYVWGGPTFVGVMAQDLLETRPDAVISTDSGYLMVDYDRIDVKMTTLADYRATKSLLGC
jgi:hypothetical protein